MHSQSAVPSVYRLGRLMVAVKLRLCPTSPIASVVFWWHENQKVLCFKENLKMNVELLQRFLKFKILNQKLNKSECYSPNIIVPKVFACVARAGIRKQFSFTMTASFLFSLSVIIKLSNKWMYLSLSANFKIFIQYLYCIHFDSIKINFHNI